MDNPNTKSFDDSEFIEFDFKKIYLSLKKGVKWVVIIPSITVFISIIYVLFIAKPIYTSEAKLLLINSTGNQSKLSSLAGQFGFSIPSMSSDVSYLSNETLPEILSSRTLAKSLLNQNFDSQKYDKPTTLLNIIMDKEEELGSADSNMVVEAAIKQISENILNIKQIAKTPLFKLQINSAEPKLSAEISLFVIAELDKLQLEFTKLELSDKKEFISERLNEVQGELYRAEAKLKNFREQNLQISLSPSLLLEQERLEREIEVQTQVYISLKQQFEQIKIEEAQNRTMLKIIDPPNIPIYRSKPKGKLVVILSGLIGIILGGGIAIIKNY